MKEMTANEIIDVVFEENTFKYTSLLLFESIFNTLSEKYNDKLSFYTAIDLFKESFNKIVSKKEHLKDLKNIWERLDG